MKSMIRQLKLTPGKTAALWILAGLAILFTDGTPARSAEVSPEIEAAPQEEYGIARSVTATLERSPRLMAIKANRDAVAQDREQVRGEYLPQVDLALGYGTDSHSDVGTRAIDEEYDFDERTEASIILVQPLFHGGDIKRRVAVETERQASAEMRVMDNAEALALDAIIAHLEVWRQRELLGLTDRNAGAHRSILAQVEERTQSGAGSIADVIQIKGRLALILSSRAGILADQAAAEANYHRLTGNRPGKLHLPVDHQELLPESRATVLANARRNNPKMAALSADIRAAAQEVEVRKASFLPRINFEMSSTYRDGEESNTDYTHNNAIMVRARWNLYNGGSDLAAREAAAARKRQLSSDRQNQYELLVEEIDATWSQHQAALDQSESYAEAVSFNDQTRSAYAEQFVVGQRSLLDLLDAENEFFHSTAQLLTTQINEMIAVYRLLALSGELLDKLGINSNPL
jgi:adhesin transport system outer membrane protein